MQSNSTIIYLPEDKLRDFTEESDSSSTTPKSPRSTEFSFDSSKLSATQSDSENYGSMFYFQEDDFSDCKEELERCLIPEVLDFIENDNSEPKKIFSELEEEPQETSEPKNLKKKDLDLDAPNFYPKTFALPTKNYTSTKKPISQTTYKQLFQVSQKDFLKNAQKKLDFSSKKEDVTISKYKNFKSPEKDSVLSLNATLTSKLSKIK